MSKGTPRNDDEGEEVSTGRTVNETFFFWYCISSLLHILYSETASVKFTSIINHS